MVVKFQILKCVILTLPPRCQREEIKSTMCVKDESDTHPISQILILGSQTIQLCHLLVDLPHNFLLASFERAVGVFEFGGNSGITGAVFLVGIFSAVMASSSTFTPFLFG